MLQMSSKKKKLQDLFLAVVTEPTITNKKILMKRQSHNLASKRLGQSKKVFMRKANQIKGELLKWNQVEMDQVILLEAEEDPTEVEVAVITHKAEMNSLPTERPTLVDKMVIGFKKKGHVSSMVTSKIIVTTIIIIIKDLVSIKELVKLAEPKVTTPQVMVDQGMWLIVVTSIMRIVSLKSGAVVSVMVLLKVNMID